MLDAMSSIYIVEFKNKIVNMSKFRRLSTLVYIGWFAPICVV